MTIQFKKRSGSTIREYNINAVVEMLKKGITEKDIMTLLAMSFCPDTRTDYLNTAKEKLEMENSAITKPTEETKKVEHPKSEKDYSLDLNYWINSNNYQNLKNKELIEKINQLTNEKIKQNWLKQIKERDNQ